MVDGLGVFLDEGGLREKQSRGLTIDWSEFARLGEHELLPACIEQFSGRCAFTEVELPNASLENLHLFRPHRDADGWQDLGEPSIRHYWWLMGSWENLYLASHDVGISKADYFPVVGERMRGRGETLDRGVLLDPCRDRPEWYLRFDTNGSVRSIPQIADDGIAEAGSTLRGDASIALHGLNASRVVSSRTTAASPLLVRIGTETELQLATADSAHRGSRRQLAAQSFLTRVATAGQDRSFVPEIVEELLPELSSLAWTEPGVGDALAVAIGPLANQIFDHGREVWPELDRQPDPVDKANLRFSKPVSAPAPRRLSSVGGAVIERFAIRNFKALEDVEVSITADADAEDDDSFTSVRPELPVPGRFLRLAQGRKLAPPVPVTPTTVLIGENGSGKSSILQALALALVSDEARNGLGLDLGGFVRDARRTGDPSNAAGDQDDDGDGNVAAAVQAEVDVDLVGGLRFELRISRDGTSTLEGWAEYGGDDPVPLQTNRSDEWFLIRAYSATRTLRENDSGEKPAGYEIGNLFDPRRTLVDAERWLGELDDNQFNVVATTLRELFKAGESTPGELIGDVTDADLDALPLTRKGTGVFIHGEPLRWVSDGYRAVLALFCDVMVGAQRFNPTDMRRARGIVLIDEIGAHLHPRWRMQIAGLLRREFPEMQIIVSTHEPLCLRGFVENEVISVARDREGTVTLRHIDRSPSSYRVDQLLTSEFFGLQSTVDPDENDRLTVYYQLAAKGPLTSAESKLMEAVRPDKRQQAFGFSYREQLTYEAVDHYLTERQKHRSESPVSRAELFENVSDIWRAFDRELRELEGGPERPA